MAGFMLGDPAIVTVRLKQLGSTPARVPSALS